MAQPTLSGSHPALLKKTLNEVFGYAFNSEPLIWPKLFKKSTTDEAWEDDQEVAGLGLVPRRREGATMAVDGTVQGYATRYTQDFWGVRLLLSEQAIFFNQYKKVYKTSELLGGAARLTQEYEHANVFIRAANTAYVGGDGLPLCSASHLLPKGGTWSNTFGTPMSLSEVAVETMSTNLSKQVGSNGLRHGYRLKSLVVPAELEFRAKKILQSDQQNDTNNNAVNILKGMGIGTVANPYFTSATNWWGKSNAENGLRSIWSREATFRETSMENAEMKEFTLSMWFSLGWTDPRKVYMSAI